VLLLCYYRYLCCWKSNMALALYEAIWWKVNVTTGVPQSRYASHSYRVLGYSGLHVCCTAFSNIYEGREIHSVVTFWQRVSHGHIHLTWSWSREVLSFICQACGYHLKPPMMVCTVWQLLLNRMAENIFSWPYCHRDVQSILHASCWEV
jgi:hypothetical protein